MLGLCVGFVVLCLSCGGGQATNPPMASTMQKLIVSTRYITSSGWDSIDINTHLSRRQVSQCDSVTMMSIGTLAAECEDFDSDVFLDPNPETYDAICNDNIQPSNTSQCVQALKSYFNTMSSMNCSLNITSTIASLGMQAPTGVCLPNSLNDMQDGEFPCLNYSTSISCEGDVASDCLWTTSEQFVISEQMFHAIVAFLNASCISVVDSSGEHVYCSVLFDELDADGHMNPCNSSTMSEDCQLIDENLFSTSCWDRMIPALLNFADALPMVAQDIVDDIRQNVSCVEVCQESRSSTTSGAIVSTSNIASTQRNHPQSTSRRSSISSTTRTATSKPTMTLFSDENESYAEGIAAGVFVVAVILIAVYIMLRRSNTSGSDGLEELMVKPNDQDSFTPNSTSLFDDFEESDEEDVYIGRLPAFDDSKV